METRGNFILSSLDCKLEGGSDHLSPRSFPSDHKCGDFCGENLKHQVWMIILKEGFSSEFVSKFWSWVFIKWPVSQGPVEPQAQPQGAGRGPTPHRCTGSRCACPLLPCISGAALLCLVSLVSVVPLFSLFLPPFLFMQISFFASLLLRPLRQAGCPTSLSSAVCLSSGWPWFFPLAPCPRARRALRFPLWRSASFQCKINTV